MAGVISKENLAAYQRWQVDSFDPKVAKANVVIQPVAAAPEVLDEEVVSITRLPTADDIERINEAARLEGYAAGFEEGRQAGEASRATALAEEIKPLADLLGNLQTSIAQMDQTIADQVLDLALEVASQVIRGTITTRSETLLPVIREAISALPLHHSHIMLHINPTDSTVIREHVGEQLTQTGVQIVDDVTISQGGCTLKAGASEIDATLETRWKRVLEAIGSEPREWLSNP